MTKFRKWDYYSVVLLGGLLYALLTLTGPIDPVNAARYNLSPTGTRLIQLTFILPIIAIWFVAFFGAIKFKKYAHDIGNSPDGKALTKVSNGLLVLAIGIVLSSIFGTLQSWARVYDLVVPFRIINRYISAAYPLIGFWVIYKGSTALTKLVKKPSKNTTGWIVGGLLLALATTFYVKSLLGLPLRNSMDPTQTSSLFLPDSLILLTVVVPTVATWILGVASALNISNYQKSVPGTIYKAALARLAKGVVFVISFSIGISLLVALTEFFQNAGLAAILAVVYLIVALWAVGYLIIASGAKKLAKIETV